MSDAGRIVIDTEDLRRMTQYLKGAVGEVASLRGDIAAARAALVEEVDVHAALQRVLIRLDAVGNALTYDHNALASDVIRIEIEEGEAPDSATAATTTPSHAGAPQLKGTMAQWPTWVLHAGSAPEPWNGAWISEDGSIPEAGAIVGAVMVPLDAGFGVLFDSRSWKSDFDSDVSADADAGTENGDLYITLHARASASHTTTTDADASTGPFSVQVEAEHKLEVKAEADLKASAGKSGVDVEGHAHAGVTEEATVSAEVDGPGVTAGGEAHAQQSHVAEAAAKGHVGEDGASGGASVAAQSYYGAGGGGSVSGPGGTHAAGSGDVGGGVGVKAGAQGEVGWEKVRVRIDAGAALGIGASLDVDVSFSPADAWNDLKDLFDGSDSDPDSPPPPPGADPNRPIDSEWLDDHLATDDEDPSLRPIDGAVIDDYLSGPGLDAVQNSPIEAEAEVARVDIGGLDQIPLERSGGLPVPAEREATAVAAAADMPQDVNTLVQYASHEEYMAQVEDARAAADKVSFFEGMKDEIAEDVAAAGGAGPGVTADVPSDAPDAEAIDPSAPERAQD